MKTTVTLIITILILNLVTVAQNTDWEIHIGLSNRDEGGRDVIEYYDKGYYVEGWAAINGDGKGWNVKTNINGELLWDNLLDHNLYKLYGWSVAIDNEGNRYIAGLKFNNGTWPFITKFNACGEEVWCKILIDEEYNLATGVMDVIINENNEIIMLSIYDDELEIEKIFLEGFSTEGEVLWKKGYASKDNYPWILEPIAYDLMEHNNEYYISGYCYWPFPSDTTHYFLRPLFIGIDSLFNEKWILPFYALDSVFGDAYYSIPISDSIILGVGQRRFYNNEVYSLLMFYDINGQELGYNQITNDQIGPDNKRNFIKDIERINDSLFIAATFFGPNTSGNPIGEFVIDTAANLYNFQSRPNSFSSPTLIKASDSNFVITSNFKEVNNDYNIYLYKIDENLQFVPFNTNTYTYDSLCPEPIQSGTIDLSGCMVWTGAEEIPSPEEYYSFISTIPIIAYPNPAETEITLAFENTEHHTNMLLECYNIYGQKVHSEKIWKGQQQTKLDVSGWSNGLYFAVVKSNGKVAGTGRFMRL
jgi:hypothetical protein